MPVLLGVKARVAHLHLFAIRERGHGVEACPIGVVNLFTEATRDMAGVIAGSAHFLTIDLGTAVVAISSTLFFILELAGHAEC